MQACCHLLYIQKHADPFCSENIDAVKDLEREFLHKDTDAELVIHLIEAHYSTIVQTLLHNTARIDFWLLDIPISRLSEVASRKYHTQVIPILGRLLLSGLINPSIIIPDEEGISNCVRVLDILLSNELITPIFKNSSRLIMVALVAKCGTNSGTDEQAVTAIKALPWTQLMSPANLDQWLEEKHSECCRISFPSSHCKVNQFVLVSEKFKVRISETIWNLMLS